MNTSEKMSWFCRLADRAGLTEPDCDRMAGKGRLRGWEAPLVRHVEQCPRCQAELAENERLARELKRLERPAAPARILPAVLERIASERAKAAEREIHSRARRAGRTGDAERRTRTAWPRERLELGAVLFAFALSCGWIGYVSATGAALAMWRVALAQAGAAVSIFRSFAGEVLASAAAHVGAVPAAAEPYVTALVWSAVGLGVAFVTAVAARGQGRA